MMQQPELKCRLGPPPPPPLPPPVSSLSSKNVHSNNFTNQPKYITICITACDINTKTGLEAVQHFNLYFCKCRESLKLLSHENLTYSTLQNGPTCGIVALSTASQLLNFVDVYSLLQKAKDMNFTKQGEMFSAYTMAVLGSNMLQCDSQVRTNMQDLKYIIIKHILKGRPILVPYDEDKNHEPCCLRGNKAHWAMVTGLCLTFEESESKVTEPNISPSTSEDYYRSTNQPLKENEVERIMQRLENIERMFLYCRQGKSKHLSAWDFEDLVLSNGNLFEYGKKYGVDGTEILGGDNLSDLRDKVVFLEPKNHT